MNPDLVAVLAGLFIVGGAIAVLLMLRVYGKRIETADRKRTILIHRILGWIFAALYAVVMYAMLKKLAQHRQLNGLQAIHMALGTAILPLLAIKILIVRRYQRLGRLLPGLGIAVFALGFVTVAMGVAPLLIAKLTTRDTSGFTPEQLVKEGEKQVQARCRKCHDIERVYDRKGKKSPELWESTLDRMVALDPPLADVRAPILAYLQARLSAAPTPEGAMLTGAALLEARCMKCHTLDRVYKYTKTREDWLATVRRYAALLPDHIHAGEIEPIVSFLFEKRGKQPTAEDLRRQVFEKHCGTCHNLSRATERAKETAISARRWSRVVRRMARLYHERELPEDELWTAEDRQTISEYLASLHKKELEGED